MKVAAPKVYKLSHSAFWSPSSGQITSQINRLAHEAVIEISRRKDKYTLREMVDMLETDPTSKACVELKSLRATVSLGDYQHSEKQIQSWVRSNFDSMEGSLGASVGQLCSAMPLGFAVSEIDFTSRCPGRWGEWRLQGINILEPTKVSFRGSKGKISHVVYVDGDGKKKYIPYNKCIHVINGMATSFNEPYGSAEARRAMPYFRSKQTLTAELLIAGKNQATGILVGQADSNDSVRMMDGNNKPIKNPDGTDKVVSAVESLAYQLGNIENSNVIATDLKNKIFPLALPTGEGFFNVNLQYINRQILLSFGVSALLFDEGSSGLGNSGISQAHKSVLDSQIEAIVNQLRDKILENIVRPLLVFNFGAKYAQNLGTFAVQASTDPNIVISKGNFLLSALSSGIIPGTDLAAVNTLREMVGVPAVDYNQMQALQQAQLQQQQMQQAALMPQQPAPDEAEAANYPG